MKFSLKLLLALTLFAGLAINGFNNLRKAKQTRTKSKELQSEVANLLIKTQFFKEKKLVYARAKEGFQRRKEKIAKADPLFEPIARVHGNFGANDPSKIHVHGSVDEKSFHYFHETYRIWIPDSHKFELCIGYHKTGEATTPTELRDSFYFAPKQKQNVTLDSGDSIVELRLLRQSPKNTIKVIVNGAEAFSAERDSVLKKGRLRILQSHREQFRNDFDSISQRQKSTYPVAPLHLINLDLWRTEFEPESFAIWLQPVGEEQQ